MFVLHMDLMAGSRSADTLMTVYSGVLLPAIAAQPGFSGAKLLLARSDDSWSHRLVIEFDNEELQKRWAATGLHAEVWAKMKPTIDRYAVSVFDVVETSPMLRARGGLER